MHFYYPRGDNITLCFLDYFEGGQGRITSEHRIPSAPIESTTKSLPATAGSTFHARAASWALAQGSMGIDQDLGKWMTENTVQRLTWGE